MFHPPPKHPTVADSRGCWADSRPAVCFLASSLHRAWNREQELRECYPEDCCPELRLDSDLATQPPDSPDLPASYQVEDYSATLGSASYLALSRHSEECCPA